MGLSSCAVSIAFDDTVAPGHEGKSRGLGGILGGAGPG
jgi:hypothetical protein